MIQLEMFTKQEPKLLHLAKLWNYAEANPEVYDSLFVSNPHELASIIKNGTTYSDWQEFLSDSRVQSYVDKFIYTQAGIVINKLMAASSRYDFNQAASAKLNSAIKYRDDHKPDFATPVQYIYIQTPLTKAEKEFLPKVPENIASDEL